MSWEVRNMRSKTSCFNMGLCKSLLKRFWPLWLAWLCLLLVQLPIRLSGHADDEWLQALMNYFVLESAVYAAKYGIVAAVLSVMAVFSHLYSKRDCGLINSLPLRRETTFITACLTGLLPLLAAAVLAWLAGLLAFAGDENIGTGYVNLWLLTVVLSILTFYGIAVFCAMLTGNILILPVLFLVLNVVAVALETIVSSLFGKLIYGYTQAGFLFTWLSPLVYLNQELIANNVWDEVTGLYIEGQFALEGLDSLAVYAAVGVALMVLSLFLYRRRQMETAGDVVAIGVLKPVFRLCASFCAGVLLPAVGYSSTLNGRFQGMAAAAVCIFLMILGAALGYYAAEMLMQKRLRVFRGTRVTGLVAVCVILSLTTLCLELDVFGYERRLPAREDILEVKIPGSYCSVDDPEAIDLYLQLHAKALENKAHNEQSTNRYSHTLSLCYRLTDGSTLRRTYQVDARRDWVDSGSSELSLAQEINKLPGVKAASLETSLPVESDTILRCSVLYESYADEAKGDTRVIGNSLRLTKEQAIELYRDCILPDMQDSSLGTHWLYLSAEAQTLISNANLHYELAAADYDFGENGTKGMDFLNITVTMDAKRTIRWLEENTDITLVPNSELYPASDSEYYESY